MSVVEILDQTQALEYVHMLNLSQEARYCGSVSLFVAMQAILLVRVYALYNRSKKLLAFLLVCFFCEAIVVLVISGMLFNFSVMGRYFLSVGPNSFGSVTEEEEVDPFAFGPLGVVDVMMQLSFDVILLAFALFAAVKHALEARRLHGAWSINPLVKALVADQIIYFVGPRVTFTHSELARNVIWQAIVIPVILPNPNADGSPFMVILNDVFNAFAVSAGPHMVISLRAQELKTAEGTSLGELSTIQFGARDLPAQSVEEREPESEPMVERGCGSARRQAEEEA
ncbi:hypothetical protein BV22DRAFT_1045350 [Leucogyrophana mollusca]|uniref:Uncharacterized protein n=1 Tax=Leucogyrophana mollusca TaxID=85980 RepID=A0ACB8BPZ8_9AGAM|nr:hypothetical protein BV22DRAFT_1045350 [Leucogyrophana mollusca]